MRYATLAALTLAALGTGCVPVTEPLSDVEKAEPDKALVGSWGVVPDPKAKPDPPEAKGIKISVPGVKGNPKGLMCAEFLGVAPDQNPVGVKGNPKGLMCYGGDTDDSKEGIWFYTTKIGKYTYANIIMMTKKDDFVQFGDVGAFASWQKDPDKRYWIFRYTIDGAKLTVDGGDAAIVKGVMNGAKIERVGRDEFYKTPAGWLASYFDKSGGDKIYDGTLTAKFRKLKDK